MSLAVLVDVGVVAIDLDTILGVLAVVAITVSADQRLVAVARSLPLVKTLGAPVGVRVSWSVVVVPIAASRVVSQSGSIAGLSLSLAPEPVPVVIQQTCLASKTVTEKLETSQGESRSSNKLPLVETGTLGAPVSVRVARTVLVVAIFASGVVSQSGSIAGLSLSLAVPVPVVIQQTCLASKTVTESLETKKGESRSSNKLPLVQTGTLGAPVSIRVARTVLVVAIFASGMVRQSGSIAGLSLPLVDTLGGPVGVGVASTILVVAIFASGMVSKGRGIAGLSLPLVETLGRPVGVGVASSVLVVPIFASGVVGKGRGIAGLSLPLVVTEAIPVVDATVLAPVGHSKTTSEKSRTKKSSDLPLVETGTLGAPVSVRIARSVLLVSIAASRVVGKSGGIAWLGFPLVKTLGGPVSVGVARSVLAVPITASGVVS